MRIKKVGMVSKEIEGERLRVPFWEVGGLLLIELGEGHFSVAQMMRDSYLRCFDFQRETEHFGEIDLGVCPILFTVAPLAIHRKGEKGLLIQEGSIMPSRVPLERYFIKPNQYYSGGFAWRGGNLVDMDGCQGNAGIDAPIVKKNLDAKKDRDTILKSELTNMWTYEDILVRLNRYFKTGVNIDQLKYKVFPDLEPVGPVTDTLR